MTAPAQLTLRALVVGALLGALLGLSNLYVGLKLGLGVAVVLNATLLGWACIAVARRLGLVQQSIGSLELVTLASTASAAGYSTGVNLATAASAHAMVTGHHVPTPTLVAWTLFVAGLGLAIAVPLKRQLIDREDLPFPTGRAMAELVRGLGDAIAARDRARVLVLALVVGMLWQAITETLPQLGEAFGFAVISVPRVVPTTSMLLWLPALAPVVAAGFTLELSALLVGSGMLVAFRVAWSMALGALLCWGVAVPRLADAGVIADVGYAAGIGWSLWLGVPLLVAAATTELLLRGGWWRRGVESLHASMRAPDTSATSSVPTRVVAAGAAVCGLACVVLARVAFDVPLPLGVLAVIAAVALASVVARAAAETDLVPTGAVGKLVQLGYAGLHPGAAVPNLMATSITAGAAASCTDLLTDLRAGSILGADARRQCIAQALGVVVGALVVVPVFVATIEPAQLGTSAWPAPAARAWHTVAVLFADGFSALPRVTAITMAIGTSIGIVIALGERVLGAARERLPSAIGLALACTVPPSHAIALFVGAIVGLVLARRMPTRSGAIITFAAGLVAGESLLGIVGQLVKTAS